MIKKIACPACGIEFEAVSFPQAQGIFCPNCATEVDPNHGVALEELGGYKLAGLLGQGGMGQVYRAASPTGAPVAVKVMAQEMSESPELQERFDREMEIMAGLDHPNIVKVLDRGKTSLFKFFVMELIEGTTLRHLIRDGKLNEAAIFDIAVQTLRALGHAHAHGIIHRDIKPENILLDHSGVVKVTDFGLARKVSFEGPALTATNAFMGTENYMSPEQKINPKAVTHRCDIYSFGVVLYEMLTGGMLPLGIFQPPSFYRPLHEFWDALTFRLLDLNPDMRPGNCDDIIREMEGFLKEPAAARRPHPPSDRPPAPPPGEHPSNDGLMKKEEARIHQHFQDLSQKAYERFQRGEFETAARHWEEALAFTSDPDERENIVNWKRACQEKLAERKVKNALVFLCPRCLKPFSQDPEQPVPGRLDCPTCGGAIFYDSLRKKWHAGEGQAVNKPATPAEKPSRKEKPQTGSPSGSILWQLFLAAVVAALLIDLWSPDQLDQMLQRVLALVPAFGLSQGSVGLIIRFVIYLFVIYWGCGLAYSLYDSNRTPPDSPPDDLTTFRRK
ncbi:MAG: serine/threonine protein kinase [Candidatus Riflebacteria bacterium]|nr:serine/threonine protein kinase [Candidatus Riflebacteria bacterium]